MSRRSYSTQSENYSHSISTPPPLPPLLSSPPFCSSHSTFHPSMSLVSFATSKRSSCDRCRKQKLRCPTKDDATQSCARCVRAGAPCVMSYTRPRGRSQKDAIPQDDEDTRKAINSALPTPNSLMSSSSENTAEEASAQSWSLLNEYEFFPSLPSSYEAEQTQTNDEGAASLHYSSLYHELGIDIHIETPHLMQDAFPKAGAEFAPVETAGSDVHAARSPTPGLMRQLDCETRLAQLNLNLCRQLKAQILYPTRCAEPVTENRTSNTSCALRDVLQSTESYIHVLQSLVACNGSGGSPETLPSNRPAPSPLTFPCMLNLTSCFFHIVDLFNAFLENLVRELDTHDLGSPSSSFQILPELKLAGLPVHEASLQIKILVLAISHHFETMERLLGLPAELRVSLQPDINTRGLLPSHWVATMQNAKEGLLGMNSCGLSNYVQSIQVSRRNISRLQGIF